MASLKEFAAFVRKNYFREFSKKYLDLLVSMDVPVLKLFRELPEDMLLETVEKRSREFLESHENGTAGELAREALERWERNELTGGIQREAIHPSDLVLIFSAQKKAFLTFLPDFTENTRVYRDISFELEDYYTEAQKNSLLLFIKEAQKNLKKLNHEQEEKIKEATEEIKLITENIPQMVWTIKADGVIEYVNKYYELYTGLNIHNVNEKWGDTLFPEEREKVLTGFKESLQKEEPYEKEYRVKSKDGSYKWFLVRNIPKLSRPFINRLFQI